VGGTSAQRETRNITTRQRFGLGFIPQGGYVREVNSPAVGVAVLSDLTYYVVGLGHIGFLHQGTVITPIGGGTIE
jgi:hypothetical protein